MALLKNSIEGKAEPYLRRIENVMAGMESRKGKYMSECKSDREDIKSILGEAKTAGVPTKALRGLVKYRELERKQKAIGEGLDIDEVSTFEILVEALGDFAGTPLGEAAVDAAKPKRGRKVETGNGEGVEITADDAERIRQATSEELGEPIEEIDRSFNERLAEDGEADPFLSAA